MTPDSHWVELVTQLQHKTEEGRVPWREKRDRMGVAGLVAFGTSQRSFEAKVGDATFELSARDGFGQGPYELKIWEKRNGELNAVAALNSNVFRSLDARLSNRLQSLYSAVNRTVENEEAIVSRLMGDVNNL